MRLTPALIGANLAASGITYALEKLSTTSDARRDDFRELALFSSEVERTRMLHKLWCVIDGMVRRERHSGILVLEQQGRLVLAASSKGAGPFDVLAVDEFTSSEVPLPAAT